uniref:Uncharacterized protein n=1 Tax=Anguilla anguilla TaxID=7936 RepID=A0A0E9XXG6_ANGAN
MPLPQAERLSRFCDIREVMKSSAILPE